MPAAAANANPAVKAASTKAGAGAAEEVAAGEAAIKAPMPGMIIRYEVKVGDRVKPGDVVVVFEAMKMENHITSPISGTVKSLGFGPGDSVPQHAVMAVISP
jgi:biotin carboxyl carrier protein